MDENLETVESMIADLDSYSGEMVDVEKIRDAMNLALEFLSESGWSSHFLITEMVTASEMNKDTSWTNYIIWNKMKEIYDVVMRNGVIR